MATVKASVNQLADPNPFGYPDIVISRRQIIGTVAYDPTGDEFMPIAAFRIAASAIVESAGDDQTAADVEFEFGGRTFRASVDAAS